MATDEEIAERFWNEMPHKYIRIDDIACRTIRDDIMKACLYGLSEGRKEAASLNINNNNNEAAIESCAK